MSDVATLSRLTPAVSQLPVDWYFDEKVFALVCGSPVDGSGGGELPFP